MLNLNKTNHKEKIILGFFLLISCLFFQFCKKPDKNEKKNVFTKKYNIESEIIVTSEKLLDPTIIEVLDSLIIVSNYKAEKLIEIFGSDGNLLKKTISRGRGPGEIYITGRMQVDNANKLLYVNDLTTKRIIECNINQLFNDEKYVPKTIFNAQDYIKLKDVHYDKILVGDSLLIGENRSPEGRLLFMDKKGKTLGYHVGFPPKEKVNSKLSEFNNAGIYGSAVTINPDLSKIALATYSAGMIDLINIKDVNNPSLIWSYNSFYPMGIKLMPMGESMKAFHTNESKLGYMDIASTNEYVYALYSGTLDIDLNYGYGNIIQVINWGANEFYELHLDQEIKRLAVSLDNSKVYGISRNKEGEPEILVFDISNLKRNSDKI